MWYKPKNESSIFTPAVLVYPDRIQENIRRLISIAGSSQRLRPHVKTHKMGEVIKLQVEQGIQKFKCATLSEVEMVAENGGLDVLLAYPTLGPGIGRFLDMMERYPKVKMAVTVDSTMACENLSDVAGGRGKVVPVFVDLDNGMHRTGIVPEDAGELIEFILVNPNLSFAGLHIYDGHIHEIDIEERRVHCDTDFEPVLALCDLLNDEGIEIGELACGGTPTFPIHAEDKSRTLCPGTPLFWDAGYGKNIPDLDFLPAAVVAGRVISKPANNVCLDLGYKSIAAEMAHPRLSFLNLEVNSTLNHSEEHLVVSTGSSQELLVGDLVYALPIHVCPTIALHERVYAVRDSKVIETWKVVARKRYY